jgi:uncharacterized cofD-like protein
LSEALAAIYDADIITIGPGSLFTSLLPPILVEGVAEAIAESSAIKIFICNLMTQPGETDGFSAHKHINIVREYAPEINFDYVLVNNRPISSAQVERYRLEGAEQIGVHGSVSPDSVEEAEIVYGNLLDEGEKVRHHPERLARVALLCAMQAKNKVLV